jgi:hypothetical protein
MTTDEHLDKIMRRCQRPAPAPLPELLCTALNSTIVAIEGLRAIADKGSHPESSSAKCDLHKIINLWPEELL